MAAKRDQGAVPLVGRLARANSLASSAEHAHLATCHLTGPLGSNMDSQKKTFIYLSLRVASFEIRFRRAHATGCDFGG